MGKGRIKRILRLCRFEFFDKGEGRHKRIQAVSPLTNSFWQWEKRMKRYSTLLFSVKEQSLETRKLKKLLAKEEEEVQKDVQRDSKVVKEYMKSY